MKPWRTPLPRRRSRLCRCRRVMGGNGQARACAPARTLQSKRRDARAHRSPGAPSRYGRVTTSAVMAGQTIRAAAALRRRLARVLGLAPDRCGWRGWPGWRCWAASTAGRASIAAGWSTRVRGRRGPAGLARGALGLGVAAGDRRQRLRAGPGAHGLLPAVPADGSRRGGAGAAAGRATRARWWPRASPCRWWRSPSACGWCTGCASWSWAARRPAWPSCWWRSSPPRGRSPPSTPSRCSWRCRRERSTPGGWAAGAGPARSGRWPRPRARPGVLLAVPLALLYLYGPRADREPPADAPGGRAAGAALRPARATSSGWRSWRSARWPTWRCSP